MKRSYIGAGLAVAAVTLVSIRSSRSDGAITFGDNQTSQRALKDSDPVAPLEENTIYFKPVDAATQTRSLRLIYIKPEIMAWWLAPQRAPVPYAVQYAQRVSINGDGIAGFRPQAAYLPPDIAQLKVIDAQNLLVAYGTSSALDELEATVKAIDLPQRQVEFTAQFVKMSAQEARALKLTPFDNFARGERVGTSSLAFGLAPAGTSERIKNLIQTKQAIVLNSPRVSVVSGLTAAVSSSISFPILLNGKATPQGDASKGKSPRVSYVNLSEGCAIHPIVQDDGSVRASLSMTHQSFSSNVELFDMREGDLVAFQFPGDKRDKTVIAFASIRLFGRAGK